MIKTLTKEQEAKIPEYIEMIINLASGETNEDNAKKSCEKMYKLIGEKKPLVLYFSSPILCHLACAFLKNKGSQLDSQLRSQLDSQLRSQLDSQLYSQLRSQLGSQLDSQLRSQLDSQLYSQLRSQLGSQLYSQLYSQLDSQLYSQLRSQLDSQLDLQLINIWRLFWLGYYYYGKYIGMDFSMIDINCINFIENVNFILPYKNVAFISAKPVKIHWNNGLLHNTRGMAVEYSDGWGIYSLNGIRFETDLGKKLINKELSFEKILGIKDVDQRNQALRFVGDSEKIKFLEHYKAEIVNEDSKKSINGKRIYYKLYKISKGDLFAEDTYIMWYECPSTGLQNFSGVPKAKTVAEAMAWKFQISGEQWAEMIPLRDEA